MATQNRTTLKTYFETGDTPTEAQFIDLIDSLLIAEDFEPIAGTGTTILLDKIGGRIYNRDTPSASSSITIDLTGAVAGAVAQFVSNGNEVTSITCSASVYIGGAQNTDGQGAAFIYYDGADVYLNWVPSATATATPTLAKPTLVVTAGDTQNSINRTVEDAAADGGVMELSADGSTGWTAVSPSFVWATNPYVHTGLTNGVIKYYRYKSTKAGYIDSPYSDVVSGTPSAAAFTNTKSGQFTLASPSSIESNAQIVGIEPRNAGDTADNPYSVSIWAKVDDIGTIQALVALNATTSRLKWNLLKTATPANELFFTLYNDNTSNYIGIKGGAPLLNSSGWVHICVTYDGSSLNTGFKLYINSILDAASTTTNGGTYTGAAIQSATTRLNIGARYSSGTKQSYVNGLLDELSIWNTELNQTDINNIYNAGVPSDLLSHAKAANVQLWTRFEDNATDSSTNASPLTATNLTYSVDVP